jgi:uncharacterized lipoprotein YajG
MKMKKQLLSKVLLMAVATFLLVSCNTGKKPAADTAEETTVDF